MREVIYKFRKTLYYSKVVQVPEELLEQVRSDGRLCSLELFLENFIPPEYHGAEDYITDDAGVLDLETKEMLADEFFKKP